jgi:hypothetical protein
MSRVIASLLSKVLFTDRWDRFVCTTIRCVVLASVILGFSSLIVLLCLIFFANTPSSNDWFEQFAGVSAEHFMDISYLRDESLSDVSHHFRFEFVELRHVEAIVVLRNLQRRMFRIRSYSGLLPDEISPDTMPATSEWYSGEFSTGRLILAFDRDSGMGYLEFFTE